MNVKTLLVAALTMATALTATAQSQADKNWSKDYKPYPYVFLGLQGGCETTFTPDESANRLFMPVGAVQLGAMFNPYVGARFDVNGYRNKGAIPAGKTYYYNYVNYDADVLVNLSSIFCPKNYHSTNVYLLGGVGLNYAWHNDDMNKMTMSGEYSAPYAYKNRLFHNFRVGAMIEQNLCKNVAVNIEVNANNVHDRYNSKVGTHGDWQLNILAGLTFKFGYKKNIKPAPVVVEQPKPQPAPKPEPKPEPKPAPKPEPKPEPKPVVLQDDRQEIFFDIAKSEVRADQMPKVEKLAQWMKNHPSATVKLDGYADAQTGNAKINKQYSEKRVAAVKKLLVEKYGIDASRIEPVTSHGDTVQPFSDNDSNRVVISYAKEHK